mgnify:FL=1
MVLTLTCKVYKAEHVYTLYCMAKGCLKNRFQMAFLCRDTPIFITSPETFAKIVC